MQQLAQGCTILKRMMDYEKFQPDLLIAIGKGGMIGGYYLAKKFDIPVFIWNAKSYTEEDKQSSIVIQTPGALLKEALKYKKNILVFDDLVDSGDTMVSCINNISKVAVNDFDLRTAVIVKKETSAYCPDYGVFDSGSERIEFEYEKYLDK